MAKWLLIGLGILFLIIGFIVAPTIAVLLSALGMSSTSLEFLLLEFFVVIVSLICIIYGAVSE